MKPIPTIDALILGTLATGEPTTARELSQTWGEEITRVNDWLKKFLKLGLVDRGSNEEATLVWLGRRKEIEAHLAKKTEQP
jgi:predicted transcriptional regulator